MYIGCPPIVRVGAALGLAALCAAGCSTPTEERDFGSISGHVYNLVSGLAVADADVSAGDAASGTDAQGYFFLPDVEAGVVTLRIERSDYLAYEEAITLGEGEHLDDDFALFPLPAYRFVLTWGEDPQNLDAHAWVPIGAGTYDHIWRGDMGAADWPPYTMLAGDDSTGFGPETIYIRPGIGHYYAGLYYYAVEHHAGDLSLPVSDAQVRIYRGTTLLHTIDAPQGTAEQGWYWYVGRLNCETGQWTPVGTYSEDPPLPR